MGASIAVDAAGNSYVTGFTQSPNFPTTSGAFDRTGARPTTSTCSCSKLNPTGTALVYSTFIGGTNFDWGRGITVDSAGNAYVTGQTKSSNFPTTSGAFDRSFNVDSCPRCGIDQEDAFVLKLNAAGSALAYSTFLGGFQEDDSLGIAIDGARNAYVTGQTGSSNFPVTTGAFDRTANGSFDAFVTKLNAAGSALVYSTRLGGEDNELPEAVKVDAAGNAYVGGSTRSAEFPTTPGAFDTTHARRRVRRALRPVPDQAEPRRFRARLLDVHRRRPATTSEATSTSTAAGTPTSSAAASRRTSRGASLEARSRPARRSSTRGRSRAARRRSSRRPTANAGSAARPARTARRRPTLRSVLQRRGRRRVRRQARRHRLACLRQLPRRLGVRGGRRHRAGPGRRRLPDRPHLLARLHDDAGRVRPHLGRRPADLLGDAFVAKVDVDATAPTVPPRRPLRPLRSSSPAAGAAVPSPVTFDWTTWPAPSPTRSRSTRSWRSARR